MSVTDAAIDRLLEHIHLHTRSGDHPTQAVLSSSMKCSTGRISAVLSEAADRGLVTVGKGLVNGPRSRPARYYVLTPAGRRRLGGGRP